MAASSLHRRVQLVKETKLEKKKHKMTTEGGKKGVREGSECVKLKMRYKDMV